ncbi:MAG TPA: plastocyanin/azurin family copper-binding protein [Gemmatimonadaceae bacterium]|nr:plastocyanin/azurin family copper-binding protein [Gemmatimonadaceae bacterium]
MSPARVWAIRVVAVLSSVSIVVALGSCVSERATTTAVVSACNVQLPPEAIGSTIVSVHDFAFTPTQVDIRAGTKVTWVNCGSSNNAAHTSTSDGGVWDSGLLVPGQTYTRQFDNAGSFPFHCTPHPFMTGTVTVN